MEQRIAQAERQIAVITNSIEHIEEHTRETRGFMEKVTGYMEKQTALEVAHQDMFAAIGRAHDRTDKLEELLIKQDTRIDALQECQQKNQPYIDTVSTIQDNVKRVILWVLTLAVLGIIGNGVNDFVKSEGAAESEIHSD